MPGVNFKQVAALIHIQVIILQPVHVNLLRIFILSCNNLKILKKCGQTLNNSLGGNIGAPYDFLVLLAHILLINFLNHVRRLTVVVRVDLASHLALTWVERQV